jgi:hypothetical protein
MTGRAWEGHRLSDAQRFDWLRLWQSESVGPRTFPAALSVDTVVLFAAIVTALEVVGTLDRNVAHAIAGTILELSKPLPADSSEKRTPGSVRNETATLARGLLRSASLRTRAS